MFNEKYCAENLKSLAGMSFSYRDMSDVYTINDSGEFENGVSTLNWKEVKEEVAEDLGISSKSVRPEYFVSDTGLSLKEAVDNSFEEFTVDENEVAEPAVEWKSPKQIANEVIANILTGKSTMREECNNLIDILLERNVIGDDLAGIFRVMASQE